MEDKKSKPRKRVVAKSDSPIVETISTISFEEHQSLIDQKISQIISLENGLKASETIIKDLNHKISDLRFEVRDLRSKLGTSSMNSSMLEKKLNLIPNWVKYLFGVK